MEGIDFDGQFVKISIIDTKPDASVQLSIQKKMEAPAGDFENQINPVFKWVLI